MKLIAGKLKGGERREKAFYWEELDISCLVMIKNEKKKSQHDHHLIDSWGMTSGRSIRIWRFGFKSPTDP